MNIAKKGILNECFIQISTAIMTNDKAITFVRTDTAKQTIRKYTM